MSMTTEKYIQCASCGNEFAFTVEEQEFYGSKGFQDPRKCKPCREVAKQNRNGGRGGGGGYGNKPQRQLYPAVCSGCGIQTEVPFQPNGSKPVYCRECYQPSY
jgi:CxxC-x17-CxxC domain-containing protein